MRTKRCTRCRLDLPLYCFDVDHSKPHGRASACKACRSAWENRATLRRYIKLARREREMALPGMTWTLGATHAENELLKALAWRDDIARRRQRQRQAFKERTHDHDMPRLQVELT